MFVRDAELLVFDDLSSALDAETERILWQRVFALQGITGLVVFRDHAEFCGIERWQADESIPFTQHSR